MNGRTRAFIAALVVTMLTAPACGGGHPRQEMASGAPASGAALAGAAVAVQAPTAIAQPDLATPASVTPPEAAASPAAQFAPASTNTAQGVPSQPPIVVLDPGHGGDELGAAANGLVEKDSNLDMALRVRDLLQARGVRVVLTRETDARAIVPPPGLKPGSFPAQRLDLQARVDLANSVHADLYLALHSNGSADPSERGVEVWYDGNRAFGPQDQRLAQLVLDGVLARLSAVGYPAANRGLKEDSCWKLFQGRCFPIFVLGPPRETTRDEAVRRGADPAQIGFAPGQGSLTTRATQMPAALAELLFISNPIDASLLKMGATRDAMAQGVTDAVLAFLNK